MDRCGAFAQRAQGPRCIRPGTSAGNRSGRFIELLIELLIKLRIGLLIQLLIGLLIGVFIGMRIGLVTTLPVGAFFAVLTGLPIDPSINLPSRLPNPHLHAALQHRRQLRRTRRIDDHAAHPRVLNHLAQPRFRIRRVQRHLRRARLPDSQQRRGQSRRALQAHPHPVLVRDTRTHQRHTQSVRPRVELRIAEPFIAAYHGMPVTAHLRTRLETRDRRHIRIRRTLRRALSTRTRPHRQFTQTPLARCAHLLQQLHVVTTHPFYRRGIEQIDRIVERQPQTIAIVEHIEHEIETRRPRRGGFSANRQPREFRIFGTSGHFVVEHRLEQRRVRTLALRLHGFHHARKRHGLVRLRLGHTLAHVSEQFADAHRHRQFSANHQRVDEKPHEPMRLHAFAATHRHADAEIMLAAVSRKQHAIDSQQRGKRRHAVRARGPQQCIRCRTRNRNNATRALHAALDRARAIERQCKQTPFAAEPATPEIQFGVGVPVAGPVALPLREVRVM
ncbi:hypothetical protein R69608_07885 [Paraburkholderia nemoris]|uniref:Uncharacterized protein n=1 Tax=Paraburkholderia nemoris TaxID=2793076 RepID=A0ABN7N9A4_9BURK|nr:hypothetical protein R69619_07787 [Paraburkholderia nemoris]CAE6861107.1 hypothetical protein R75777_08040 [Paraburkholderia nemoris]CAE6864157.1 hypothetical protein R69776_08166 [Paraburkholderia nemoris]CAE6972867.1 hypothetical protein R69608_07885 [Paraburkholderia nemoris]